MILTAKKKHGELTAKQYFVLFGSLVRMALGFTLDLEDLAEGMLG